MDRASNWLHAPYTDKIAQDVRSLLTSCNNLLQQAVIRMRSHGLQQLSTDLLQVDYYNLLSTGLLQAVSTSCNKSANDKLQQA